MAEGKHIVDLFQNPISAGNCGVALVLRSSRTLSTLRSCAPYAPCTCLAVTSFKRGLLQKIAAFIILLLLFILSAATSYAGAWLPEVGTYNLYSSHSFIDERSRKIRNIRKGIFINMQNDILELGMAQVMIRKRAVDLGRELLNSELRSIEQIKRDIDLLEQESEELSSFSDESSSYFELEYGLADSHSFGTKLGYKTDKFADINSGKTLETKPGQEIDIFYKYKFFDNESLVATIRPKIHFSTYNKRKSLSYTDFELLVGHSRIKKGYGTYFECGIAMRKYYSSIVDQSIGYVLSMQEGIKLGKGFTVSNYTEYEKTKFTNILYRRTIYDQVSIAKEIAFDNLMLNCFTAQVGYFWKGSLVDRFYTVSGPIFSVWLNL